MSAFYDLASLVLVPSGYKASKVYAQKPLTTDGQLTFSRASTATRVNSAGLIETVSSNVPRLDYQGSTCPKLLLEPQRSNLALQSNAFNNAAWTNASTTITNDYGISPDGTQNADRFQQTTIGALQQTISVSASTAYTVSFYCKLLGGTSASLGVYNFNSNTFIFQDNLFSSLVLNQWVRVTRTFTTPVGCTLITGELWRDSTIDCLVYGFQLEQGAYPTSLIQTTSAAVTRLADDCNKTGIGSLVSTTGTLFIDFVWNGVSDGVADNTIFGQDPQYYGTTNISISNYNGNLYGRISNGLTIVSNLNANIVLTAGVRYKVAFAFQNNDIVLFVNGTLRNFATSGTIPATSSVYLNNNHPNNKSVNQALVFKTRLTNAQLAELTAL